MDFNLLLDTATKAALEAGAIIRQYMDEEVSVKKKSGMISFAAQVVTEVDLKCEKIILEHLTPISKTNDIAILSEETQDDGSRFEKDYFWCIDPMDGTLAFINKRPGFCVSIALVAKDGTPIIGVVFDPSNQNMYHAIKGQGAFKNNAPWIIQNTNSHLTYVTDKKLKDTPRLPELKKILKDQAAKLSLDEIKEIDGSGSVMNGIHVLENGPACMFKFPKEEKGGGSLWDFAAIACIFHELNLTATNFKGGKLELNKKEDCFMNHEGVFFGNLIIEA